MQDLEADLVAIRPKIEAMARARTAGSRHLADDAEQEALIAAWQERVAHPEAPLGHAVTTAKFRISKVLQGRPLTGNPRKPGQQDASTHTRPLTAGSGEDEHYVAEPTDISTERAAELVEARDERIYAAVRNIEDPLDRQAIHLHFWQDLDWRETAKTVGRSYGGMQDRWFRILKPRLKEVLADVA